MKRTKTNPSLKTIEVVEGFLSMGETGHIKLGTSFGLETWVLPNAYVNCPNPDSFRKVRITFEELK